MRNAILSLCLSAAFLFITSASSAQSLNEWLNKARKGVDQKSSGGASAGKLTNTEIVNGLKQALEKGAQEASSKLSATNGFFGNSLIKVLMPPEAAQVESALRSVGMGSVVDKAILAMNRAAEDASAKAAPIFVNAIKGLTVQDGLSILTGSNDAATNYLRRSTTASLTSAFKPVIQSSLGKTGATAYWGEVFSLYNRLPTTRNKINPDLTAYVTERALNGLFVNIAQEEAKIRSNPAARTTDLLRKVFGSQQG